MRRIPFVEMAPDWKDETVAILASGPSLASVDLLFLNGSRTIVLNDAIHKLPTADILLLCDRHWTKAHPEAGNIYKGPQIIVLRPEFVERIDPRMVAMKRGPHDGISSRRGELNGRNTAVSHAINLAVHKGVARILLLGVDLQPGAGERRHYHNNERDGPTAADRYAAMAESLATQAEPLKALGIEVINCSPRSRLACYPIMSLAEALSHARAA